MSPNLFLNFQINSLSSCCRLVRVVDIIQCDQPVAYYALKHLTRVLKLSMNLGGSPLYQVNVIPLRDVGKTRNIIASSLVYIFS